MTRKIEKRVKAKIGIREKKSMQDLFWNSVKKNKFMCKIKKKMRKMIFNQFFVKLIWFKICKNIYEKYIYIYIYSINDVNEHCKYRVLHIWKTAKSYQYNCDWGKIMYEEQYVTYLERSSWSRSTRSLNYKYCALTTIIRRIVTE